MSTRAIGDSNQDSGPAFGPTPNFKFGSPFGLLLLVMIAAAVLSWGFYQWAMIGSGTETGEPSGPSRIVQKPPDVLETEIQDLGKLIRQYKQTQDATLKLLTVTFGVVVSLFGWAVVSGLKLMRQLTEMKVEVRHLKEASETLRVDLNGVNNTVNGSKLSIDKIYDRIGDLLR